MVHAMLKKMLVIIILIGFTNPLWADSKIAKVMVFGDSLSAAYGINYDKGWVTLLEQRLAAQDYDIEVINASISGNTTGNGLNRIKKDLAQHKPDLLILELGGNDGLRGQSLKRMQNNLETMIEISEQENVQVLLVAMRLPPSYGRRYTEAFAKVYPLVAEKYGVPLVKEFIDNIGVESDLMQNDGIHPNEKGQPVLLDNIWPALKELLDAD